jgi:hypothetical protein
MPPSVAARPRDERGYPVPAITPWREGKPAFASLSSWRTLICLAERRCSVCGLKMPSGPVYRVVTEEIASDIARALDAGVSFTNLAPSGEAPGHWACMLYSAVACPHLTSPTSRRTSPTSLAGQVTPNGDVRGAEGGVAGFEDYTFRLVSGSGIEIHFGQPTEIIQYGQGIELLDELSTTIAGEREPPGKCPDYLTDDDDKAEATAKRLLLRDSGVPDITKARQQERARKDRRKALKAARRRNR